MFPNKRLFPAAPAAVLLSTLVSLSSAQTPSSPVYTPGKLTPTQQVAREVFKELIEINTERDDGATSLRAPSPWRSDFARPAFPDSDIFIGGSAGRQAQRRRAVSRQESGERESRCSSSRTSTSSRRSRRIGRPTSIRSSSPRGRLLLRARHRRRQGDGLDLRRQLAPNEDSEGYVPDRDIIIALTADEESGALNGVDWLVRTTAICSTRASRSTRAAAERCATASRCSTRSRRAEDHDVTSRCTVDQSRRPFVGAAKGQRHLRRSPTGCQGRPRTSSRCSSTTSRARSSQRPRNRRRRRWRARCRRSSQNPKTRRAAAASCRRSAIQLDAPHDVRRDDAVRRTRDERAAAARRGEHQLSHLPDAIAGVRARRSPQRDRRHDGEGPRSSRSARRRRRRRCRPRSCSPVTRVTKELFGDVPVIPTMSTGANDSRFFRALGIPVVRCVGLFCDPEVDARAHGRDERIRLQSYYEGQEFLYRLTKLLASNPPARSLKDLCPSPWRPGRAVTQMTGLAAALRASLPRSPAPTSLGSRERAATRAAVSHSILRRECRRPARCVADR